MTAALSRKSLICNQAVPVVTGIDSVQVVDPQLQTELLVFFIVDPDLVQTAAGPPPTFAIDLSGGVPLAAAPGLVTIAAVGAPSAPVPQPVSAEWDRVIVAGAARTVLRLRFAAPGGFDIYALTVNLPQVDPFFNEVEFSFKQGCETGFDCAPDCDCPPAETKRPEIDYLARDFDSFNSALHDFTRRYYPRWSEHLTADAASMLIDLLAALGDEFAYMQDRFAREPFLELATQRRSLQRLARLVDYVPDPGRNARALLSLSMQPVPVNSVAIRLSFAERLTVWASAAGVRPVPFELGRNLDDTRTIDVHHHWNRMPLHLSDPSQPCLKAGQNWMYLAPGQGNVALPRATQLPPGQTPATAWLERWMVLSSAPSDPSVEARAWAVQITKVEQLVDPIVLTGGGPSEITRVEWDAAQALPFDLRIAETLLYGNTVEATAGMTVTERFAVGHETTTDPLIAGLPGAVERESLQDPDSCERATAIILGLRISEAEGVAFTGERNLLSERVPEIDVKDVSNPVAPTQWNFAHTLLDADEDDPAYTLDPGMWRDIVRYHRDGEIIVHSDYAGDFGWSVRFGGGGFGVTPAPDSLFAVRYRTFAGSRSNLPAGTIRALDPPDGSPRKPALAAVAEIVNLLPAADGVDPETPIDIRRRAPEYYRAFPLRAVRDEDYREIIERLDWVSKGGAEARWTGSWLTEFVTADPDDAFEMSADQLTALGNLVDAVRQAGRDVVVRQPRFLSVDLDITICVEDGFYAGQVREAVLAALAGGARGNDRRFFDPDNFTFGEPLRRSALEAAVQAVPGVRGVTGIRYRPRNLATWQPFEQPEIGVAINELVRIQNDARYPERGAITVRATTAPCQGGACP
ncbi:baseplate J/gp47 family protein [Mesorhizobium sp. IMUNJ 23232]|uniref:baseplate J/gp47 family protein n=1 Tax=Mesorhizobium sp. IMUNJ 23232 TaxID=3376064 RepID=UPI0037A67200